MNWWFVSVQVFCTVIADFVRPVSMREERKGEERVVLSKVVREDMREERVACSKAMREDKRE